MVYRPGFMDERGTMKRLIYLSLVLLLLSGCEMAYATPPANTNPPIARDLFATPISTVEPKMIPTPSVPSSSLRRGVNLGNMLEAPNEGEWGLTVQEEYFDLIKKAGFDFVRLPVRWSTHADESAPYAIDPAFFARVDEVIGWASERDLTVIVNIHHYEEMAWDPWAHKDRFICLWEQIAEHYKDSPSNVLFELLNEPNDQLNASLWNEYLLEALSIVREANPTRDVVIGPVNWNAYDWISTLDVPQDEHIIVTFHYYLPFEFTHQGADWVQGSDPWLGRTWEATEAETAEIVRHFNSVADWAQRKNVRILLGEFGAYSEADMTSRIRWTEFVRSEAERHEFAWAYWEFASGFGIYDPEAKIWREDLLKALIP